MQQITPHHQNDALFVAHLILLVSMRLPFPDKRMNFLLMKTTQHALLILSILTFCFAAVGQGADRISVKDRDKIKEAELAIHRFKLPDGMRAEVFAAEPFLANPVAICLDERNRVYVAETFRLHRGVEDNRGHMNWLLDDLAAQTVADRVAYTKKWLKDDIGRYAVEQERVRLLEDLDGDGRADQSTVFADGFNAIEDGLAAGVLAHEGTVYFTCIPKLWRLRDTDGAGVANEKTVVFDGFGVRFAFTGHDLHGLVLGPDGRLYFSIGDRGFNVELKDRQRLALPDQGAVFRCELDGSNFEVFCQGLRNPQELAFDDLGNLFTGDNNSDSGDQARWVYLPEGSDSGWRMYFQYHPDRGPWNREKLWHPKHPGQPAHIVPPIANFANGPSGLTYYPGTGLDEKYNGHFFLVDFRGQSSNSGIRSFTLNPQGASFELVDAKEFIWSILATDVEFGFDGAMYVSDWVEGWGNNGQGRIYRFRDNSHADQPVVQEVTALMKVSFATRSPAQLTSLLDHPDYRIRLRSQLALVKADAFNDLAEVARHGKTLSARIHAIWGIGQMARKSSDRLSPVLSLFSDSEPEIRAQMARVCGDCRRQEAASGLRKLLKDSSARVRSLAAIAVGRIGDRAATPALFEALEENADHDPTLRHCLVMGLVGTATAEELAAAHQLPSPSVRLGAVVALRRLKHPGLSLFIDDADPLVVAEAARAIHDLRITSALPSVAKLIGQPTLSDPVLRRAISANYLLGNPENASAVVAFAANPSANEQLRLEALVELSDWNNPGPLDRVTNEYRRLPDRSVKLEEIIRPRIEDLFNGPPGIQESSIQLASRLGIGEVDRRLVQMIKDDQRATSAMRLAALNGLQTLKSPQFNSALDAALSDTDPAVRGEARRLLAHVDPGRAVKLFAEAFRDASDAERQSAIKSLSEMKRPDADALLGQWFDLLAAGSVSTAIELDLMTAAQTRGAQPLLEKLAQLQARRSPEDHLKDYRETLTGGAADRGRVIFFEKSEVSCRRCHKVQGQGGDVGPDLSRIGRDKTREYLLESMVDPNKQIAKGFETVILQMSDGKVYAGIIKQEDEQSIQMIQPDGRLISLSKPEIEERATGKSGMPDDLIRKLSKFELRDLVEFLTTQTSDDNSPAHGNDKK